MIESSLIRRPGASLDAVRGLLHAEHFQVAYATSDMAAAKALFVERFGIREFRQLSGDLPAGGEIHVELAWLGPVMYELLTARGPGSELYIGRLPAEGFAIRHHHLGYLVHDRAQWDALMAEIAREGRDMPHRRCNPGFLESCIVDAPELGHYLEYILPEEAGRRFFEDVPRN
jgi:hypothetical protein